MLHLFLSIINPSMQKFSKQLLINYKQPTSHFNSLFCEEKSASHILIDPTLLIIIHTQNGTRKKKKCPHLTEDPLYSQAGPENSNYSLFLPWWDNTVLFRYNENPCSLRHSTGDIAPRNQHVSLLWMHMTKWL